MVIKVVNKRLREERFKQYVEKGYSANKIQKLLKDENLGMRRKVLLTRVREERGLRKRREGTEYKPILKEHKFKGLYRMSLIILDLPVHSTKTKPNYLGFRLTAFSLSRDLLLARQNQLKRTLLDKTIEYVGYDIRNWDGYDFHIGTENPVFIPMSEDEAFTRNNTWVFVVEQNGFELGGSKDSGRL